MCIAKGALCLAHPAWAKPITPKPMQRILVLLYGIFNYVVFQLTALYAAGFVGDFGVPKSIDSAPTQPFWLALSVNLGLLSVFSLQHSVMARPAFKRWWTRYVPESAERSTYVLFSCIALILLFAFWEPMGGVVWKVEHPVARGIAYTLFASGWLLVVAMTYQINHFDLFGLRQVWLHFRKRPYTQLSFGTPGLYRFVRHPLYVGWLLGFWATPTMTVAHLVFALATTAYILIAIRFEERDLVAVHGDRYAQYQATVPMLIPRPARKA
jgi:methanethiol S-methyltransferase